MQSHGNYSNLLGVFNDPHQKDGLHPLGSKAGTSKPSPQTISLQKHLKHLMVQNQSLIKSFKQIQQFLHNKTKNKRNTNKIRKNKKDI